jgi:beta-lactamase superfamily II metal-dependent hydrolase
MKKHYLIFILLFLSAFYFWQFIFSINARNSNLVEMNFFDIGQGDSILIEMQNSTQVLIDGGPSRDVVGKIAKEMPYFDKQIELVILTHPDRDHITGLFEVFEGFEIGKVLIPKMDIENRSSKLYKSFLNITNKEGSEVIFAKQGQKISFGEDKKLYILWPSYSGAPKMSDTNDFSIVGRFSYGDVDLLLTGDISDKIENYLLQKYNLKSEILKVAHHGSKYSTGDVFLQSVTPEVAVISVGKNSYGHPTEEVLDRLWKYDIKTLRTDKNGNIKIISDGNNIVIK